MMMPGDALSSAVSLSSRPHPLDGAGLPMSIPCTSNSMFPPGMLKLDKSVYSSPPPAANTPENNCCKLIEYRGHKIAAFAVDRKEMICLPQAFEMFLKHLVGGLHTVYTKLKRLGITPVVCNVEQVRILRGLGAIQPGVNRCKLIGPKEFDVLYEDCTNSSARPGRPPKRSSPSPDKTESPFRVKQPRIDGEVHGYPPYKWMDLMKTSPLFGNGYYYPPQMAAHLQFMPHPAMMNMAMNGHLPPRPNGILDVPKDLSSPIKDLSMDRHKIEELNREKNNNTHHSHGHSHGHQHHTNDMEKPLNLNTRDLIQHHIDNDDSGASCSEHDDLSDVDLDLSSPSPAPSEGETHQIRDSNAPSRLPPPMTSSSQEQSHDLESRSQVANDHHDDIPDDIPGPGSVVALLLNVQGLLRMAVESAKHREQKYNSERADLKRDITKEKERREHLEIQLDDTQKTITLLEKKLKRERKLLRRIQESINITTSTCTNSSSSITHIPTSGHMTSGHMPVFPHPTTQSHIISSPNDSSYSSGTDNIHSNHSNNEMMISKHDTSLQEDDDSEVPRNVTTSSSMTVNGHTVPLQDESRDGVCED